ncbi:MAG: helix-turn-helix domain-containing protein [Micromonosporaceae bacterium]
MSKAPQPTDSWMTSKEVAALLAVSTKTLDYWAHTRQGPPWTRVGRHRRYKPTEVNDWLAKQEKGGEGT